MLRLLLVAVVCIPITSTVHAQPQTDAAAKHSLLAPANLTFGVLPGAPTTILGPASAVQFVLDASAKEKVGIVTIGRRAGNTGQNHLLLTFSAPLDTSSSAAPVSLRGPSTGSTVKLSINRLNWRGPTPLEQLQIRTLCQSWKLSNAECDYRKLAEPHKSVIGQLQHLFDIPWLAGGDVSVETSNFKFRTVDTLAASSTPHNSVTANARLGYFTPSFGFLFASVAYRNGWEAAGSPTQLCRPLENVSALRCDNAVLGPPVQKETAGVTVELRRFSANNIAINPSVQRVFMGKPHWSVDVPTYFIKDSTGTAIGGVRFGWRSDTQELTAVIFVGAALSLSK